DATPAVGGDGGGVVDDSDATLVDGDLGIDEKRVGSGQGAVIGPDGGVRKVLAWLDGQSSHTDSYKAALLDPDSRFPAVVTANPVTIPAGVPLPPGERAAVEDLVGRWLSGEKSTAGWTSRDWNTVARARRAGEAAVATAVLRVVEAHNPHSFRRYRTALDPAHASGNPLLVAGRLLRADDDLMGHRGIDVFGLGWRALS
ncbi:hypothetical protein PV350_46830, partial [Streptomyces sp. PA03-6a]|nr:hypothetical protein [Streptomyces sp. PA03-6a]